MDERSPPYLDPLNLRHGNSEESIMRTALRWLTLGLLMSTPFFGTEPSSVSAQDASTPQPVALTLLPIDAFYDRSAGRAYLTHVHRGGPYELCLMDVHGRRAVARLWLLPALPQVRRFPVSEGS